MSKRPIDLGPPSSENTPISKPTFKRMKKQPVFDVAPAERRNVFFSTRKRNASQSLENMRNLTLGKICPKDVLHGEPLFLCPVMAPFSPLLRSATRKLKASKQKLRRFYVGGQLVFVETYRKWSRNKKNRFMQRIQAGCLQRFILISFL